MQPQWIRLEDGTWLNLGSVVTIQEDEHGRLRLEHIGDRQLPPDQHTLVSGARDIALIRTYLQQATVAARTAPGDAPGDAPSVLITDDLATIMRPDGTEHTIPRAEWEALGDQERADLS
ncbi:MAG: hypothetical protein KY444_11195 [Gemmatimonadetes bacterium]|nr:hypothetical protein [Gemmatimonadota bacterium]